MAVSLLALGACTGGPDPFSGGYSSSAPSSNLSLKAAASRFAPIHPAATAPVDDRAMERMIEELTRHRDAMDALRTDDSEAFTQALNELITLLHGLFAGQLDTPFDGLSPMHQAMHADVVTLLEDVRLFVGLSLVGAAPEPYLPTLASV